ncbi:hypothetical protein [Rhizobium grahamii]|uniref:Uncharacterized protein n=1 Tax=Rhizobium grahamii TaxID=1120045 RepID=A0A370KF61_9HYPH|nr:hypothetical protein [Rhizobium grahamii]RDJ02948.1 hypothetical protein B5K06_31100 [Rhizobium grahamii]
MNRFEETRTAIFDQLRKLKADPSMPINLLEIGPSLVAAGYEQNEIVNTLFHLEEMGEIALMEGNRVRLKKPLD